MKTKAYLMSLMLAGLVAGAFTQTKTITLQQGLDGYSGCTDKELRDPARNYGKGPTETTLLVNDL